MVSEIPIKENQSQSHVKRKWPDGWSGGGGGRGGAAITRGRGLIEERLLLGGIRHPPTVVHFKYRKGD